MVEKRILSPEGVLFSPCHQQPHHVPVLWDQRPQRVREFMGGCVQICGFWDSTTPKIPPLFLGLSPSGTSGDTSGCQVLPGISSIIFSQLEKPPPSLISVPHQFLIQSPPKKQTQPLLRPQAHEKTHILHLSQPGFALFLPVAPSHGRPRGWWDLGSGVTSPRPAPPPAESPTAPAGFQLLGTGLHPGPAGPRCPTLTGASRKLSQGPGNWGSWWGPGWAPPGFKMPRGAVGMWGELFRLEMKVLLLLAALVAVAAATEDFVG